MLAYGDKISFFLWIYETTISKQFSLKNFLLFCLSILTFKMSWNMCKLRHKVGNGQNIPLKFNFKLFQSCFSNKIFYFHFRPSKTYSSNPSLKSILGLYVFEKFEREAKILFEKSELNFENSVGTQIYMAEWTLI